MEVFVDIADYNGDGRDDVLWRSDSNWMVNWLGTEAGGFINNHGNSVMSVDAGWRVVAPDVLWM